MLAQDLRYASRTLRKSAGFTAVAILTLALGIGANTAIFSIVDAAVLRPLPYRDPDRLVELWGNVKRVRVERRGASYPDFQDWRTQSRSFEAMAAFDTNTVTLTGGDEPERLSAEVVSQPYFSLLGVRPEIGRTFRPEEDAVPQRDFVVILGNGLWKRRFGGDPAVLGKIIRLADHDFTIIGVMPAWFRGLSDTAELWAPFMISGSAQDLAQRSSRGFAALAQLKPGVTLAQAQSEMDGISKSLEAAYPRDNEGRAVELSPLETEILGDLRKPLLLLLAAVGFVLLIACTNVANLLLARSEARQRELAVRIALGAGRGRMIHQLTAESCLLAFGAAAAGLLLARFGLRALIAASPITFPSYIHAGLNPEVAIFTVAVSVAAGLALGIAPAVQVQSGNIADAFKQASSHAVDSRAGRRFRNVLVVAEVAFATLLLVGAGLLIRSVQKLAAIHPGYDPSHLLTLRVALPRIAPPPAANTPATGAAAPADARTVATARETLRRIAQIPSVQSVAAASDLPMGGSGAIFYTAEGQSEVTAQNMPRAYIHRGTPEFFRTLGIRFVAGRAFTDAEIQSNALVAVVSENLVKRFWPGQDPIGKRFKGGRSDSTSPWISIVGVINEMKYRGLPNNPTADPDIFLPFLERARNFALLVRTPLDPASLAPSVRKVLRDADPATVIFNVSTMEKAVATQTASSRFMGWLMGLFAASALLLAAVGIYGVMAYTVSRRTQEIGIRMALGAPRSGVVRAVVSHGMALVALGLALGAVVARSLAQFLGTLLYGVTASDLATFAAAPLILAAAALLACLIPAARATRIDPALALRGE